MEFASRVSVMCFAACYAIGLVAELFRLLSEHRSLRWLATLAALAGMLAQTLFLIHRGWVQGGVPISSQFELLLVLSWAIGLIYLGRMIWFRRGAFGVFVLPVSLGLVVFAALLTNRDLAQVTEKSWLPAAHGILLLLGMLTVLFAALAALMYLIKIRQLKQTKLAKRWRHWELPSLERLASINATLIYLAWPFLTIGILLGMAMRRLTWTDPKVILTIVTWMVFTAVVQATNQAENRGRRLALWTMLATLLVIICLLGDPWLGTSHQAKP